MTIPLETAASAFFGPDGIATVTVGPGRANIGWMVKRLVTSSTSTEIDQPILKVYRNVETPSALLDSTYSGNSAVSETNIRVSSSERLVFIWTGGTPGAEATIVISGDIT